MPVAVGTALSWSWNHHHLVWWRVVATAVVALSVQVGTNYANDVADGVRGTDTRRAGPVRLVASGLASARAVRIAALVAFGVAGVAGLALAAATAWWLIAVGAACFAAGWLYSGGPRPYGYAGFGEVFVFGFFGVVATMGTVYVQTGQVLLVGFVASIPVGLLSTALLEANNLRDRRGDAQAGKRTLAVRLGRRRGGMLYVGMLVGTAAALGVLASWRPWVLLGLLGLPLAFHAIRLAAGNREGRDLVPMLAATARLQVVTGVLVTIGLLV